LATGTGRKSNYSGGAQQVQVLADLHHNRQVLTETRSVELEGVPRLVMRRLPLSGTKKQFVLHGFKCRMAFGLAVDQFTDELQTLDLSLKDGQLAVLPTSQTFARDEEFS